MQDYHFVPRSLPPTRENRVWAAVVGSWVAELRETGEFPLFLEELAVGSGWDAEEFRRRVQAADKGQLDDICQRLYERIAP